MTAMFNAEWWRLIPLALLLLLPLGVRTVSGVVGHLAESRCQDCHLSDQVTPEQARMLVYSQEKMCAPCHAKTNVVSHPSGFVPNRILPAQFPVDWKGELTCGSCHVVHGSGTGLLRSPKRGAEFCLECHDKAFFERMADRGKSVVESGHLKATATDPARVELDGYSLQCMSCHEEQNGTAPQLVNMDPNGILLHRGSTMTHPVGRSYTSSIRVGGYRPAGGLPAAIVLPDGKVGCVSCHLGYGKQHGALTVDNQQSGLCYACHDL
ncbi:MAG: cytochrome c3 family protein [Magnetococcales bacterium]|nr:cytochrome c3 family protein [Magnetococcales bacterium]